MLRNLTFYTLLLGLALAGLWGTKRIFSGSFDSPSVQPEQVNAQDSHRPIQPDTASSLGQQNRPAGNNEPKYTDIADELHRLLDAHQYERASEFLNDNYSNLSSEQLAEIRQHYQQRANQLYHRDEKQQAKAIWQSATQIFDDLEAWSNLALLSVELKQWRPALDALLKASYLENDSQGLLSKQQSLVRVAAYLRAELEAQGDDIGIKALYQTLYDAHPGYPRFQLDLAHANLKLGQLNAGRSLLEQLQYDLELGEIAKQSLATLEQNLSSDNPKQPLAATASQPEIVVPLQRLGTSLIATLKVKNRSLPLLLDTGASITAFDTELISALGLRPTGQAIQLSTANGITRAPLYHAGRMQLGQFSLNGHVIAAIDLGNTSRFKGLLGTDILNSLNRDFNFVIDNNRNALVFKKK